MIQAQSPLLLSSNTEIVNQSELLKVNDVITNIIEGTSYKIEGGEITGINDPINLSDAVNKNYADIYITNYPPQTYQGILNSIQYSQGNTFQGNSNLLFSNNNLISSSFSDSISLWTNNKISNLFDPEENSQIATKNYVDTSNGITPVTININSNFTYDPNNCINTIIYRNFTSSVITDITPPALTWIPFIKNNKSTNFSIKNISNNFLRIVPNLNVNILYNKNNISYIPLYTNYQVNLQVIINGNIISILIKDIIYLTDNQNLIRLSNDSFYINIVKIQNSIFKKYYPTYIIVDFNSEYSTESILSGLIYRGPNLTSNKIDSIINLNLFSLSIPFLSNDPVGITFRVINLDSIYSITLNTNTNNWNPDLSNISTTIGPNKTGYFGISIKSNVGTIYTIGIN